MTSEKAHVTTLLDRARDGDAKARNELLETIYDELRVLARSYMRGERRDHTLGTTALTHEAYLHLLQGEELPGRNRSQLLAFVAKAMRHILVDHARGRGSLKRGGGRERVELRDELLQRPEPVEHLAALDEALQRLERIDQRKGRVVELRFFGGLSVEEIGKILEISPATVKRDWQVARTWLFRELMRGDGRGAG